MSALSITIQQIIDEVRSSGTYRCPLALPLIEELGSPEFDACLHGEGGVYSIAVHHHDNITADYIRRNIPKDVADDLWTYIQYVQDNDLPFTLHLGEAQ